MPAFHLLRCVVGLGGDQDTQVYRDRTRPIVFPELPILQFIHGEDAITEVHVVGVWETTNEEVLQRLQTIYQPETLQAVFPGARPRLPMSDASIPRCTLPIYKPRPTRPANPDPRLRPLDQFTVQGRPEVEAPELPEETEPTPDEIAAHAQEDEEDLGFTEPGPVVPGPEMEPIRLEDLPLAPIRLEDLPHIVRDTHGRGSSRSAPASRTPSHLPDVNAGGSHSPTYRPTSGARPPSAAQDAKRRG